MITSVAKNDVQLITLNDQKVNVLNVDSLTAIRDAVKGASDQKAIVLTGEGKCFSAGLDLKLLPTLNKEELFGLLGKLFEVMQAILTSPCPVIAAINGHCIAGGAVISLCCDQAIGAKKDLKIGLSEVAVGMPLPKFAVELARARLAPTKLTEAVLFGKLYGWEEAIEVGYLHAAVEPDALVTQSLAVAELLTKLPREAYTETKKVLYSHLPETLGAEAVGAFLTDQAQKHMAQFNKA